MLGQQDILQAALNLHCLLHKIIEVNGNISVKLCFLAGFMATIDKSNELIYNNYKNLFGN